MMPYRADGRIMQSRDFCFWLQGFFELSGNNGALTAEQAAKIACHLDLVFAHEITPSLRERPATPMPEPAPPRPAPVPERERETPPDPEPPRPSPPPPRC
jgi:hypothetical protein